MSSVSVRSINSLSTEEKTFSFISVFPYSLLLCLNLFCRTRSIVIPQLVYLSTDVPINITSEMEVTFSKSLSPSVPHPKTTQPLPPTP